jgi:multidrug efflux pump subunit AcrA (membrane-fusion protein)
LRAEAFVNIDALSFPLENANAELEVTVNGKPMRVLGKVTFVSPEIDPINRETTVWVEFDNPELLIKPGMHGEMQIYASH